MRFQRYKRELEYSYALGMAPTIELINRRPELVLGVFAHPDYRPDDAARAFSDNNHCGGAYTSADCGGAPNIFGLCAGRGLPCETNLRIFNLTANKENIYVAAAFRKPAQALAPDRPHAVFVNPADAGNLGTNYRTCLGFGIRDVAVITPGADIYSPKTVRASMGAVFHINAVNYASYADYATAYPGHEKYFFMLNGETELNEAVAARRAERAEHAKRDAAVGRTDQADRNERAVRDAAVGRCGQAPPFSLVFGNEATGLPDEFLAYGNSVRIAHSNAIDSLNLSVAVGIAAYAFSK